MARKKKAWGPSNPLWRYLNRGKGSKTRRGGGKMARRKKGGSRSFGKQNTLVRDVFVGMGAAAAAKRFIGAPLGGYTGAAAGGAAVYLTRGSLLGGLVGGFVHDNIGNTGGMSGSSSGGVV